MDRRDAGAVLAIAGVYAGMMALGVTCPIRFLTGVSCAGCGMTRAWLCLARLDVAGAFAYHPLFWLPAPAAVGYLCRHRMSRRMFRLGTALVCALFLGVYLLRLAAPGDVVVWRPQEGLLFRLLFRPEGGSI